MKNKIAIIVIIGLAIMPYLVSAQSYPTCPAGQKFAKIITDKSDPFYGKDCPEQQEELRLRAMETQIRELQAQIATQTGLSQAQSTGSDTTRITALENRVTILEKTMSVIQQSVMSVLQSVMNYLQKLQIK